MLRQILALCILVAQPSWALTARNVIDANLASRSYSEWLLSGATPEALFASASPVELCSSLVEMDAGDLVIFDHEIEHSALPCQGQLQAKLERFWQASQADADVLYREMREENDRSFSLSRVLDLGWKGLLSNPLPVLLPSIERVVTAANIGAFHTEESIRQQFAPGEIAITLDDGPHSTRSAAILNTLARYGVRATYFQVGEMIHDYPTASKRIADAGHSMGSHTWSHPITKGRTLVDIGMQAASREILSAVDEIERVSGQRTKFFRFPGGIRNQALLDFVESRGIVDFRWNMDEADYSPRLTARQVYERAVRELDREGKGILLCHDIHQRTVQALPLLLEELRRRGMKTVVFVPEVR